MNKAFIKDLNEAYKRVMQRKILKYNENKKKLSEYIERCY